MGINLVNELLIDKHSYLTTMTDFLAKSDIHPFFICGEIRQDKEYDYVILNELFETFGGILFCEYVNYIDFLKQLARCKVVVTMRMHIMIFCALIGVPCIPMIREPKMQLMADSLGLSITLSLDESLENLTNTIDLVFDEPSLAFADFDKVKDLKTRAMANGTFLQHWMED